MPGKEAVRRNANIEAKQRWEVLKAAVTVSFFVVVTLQTFALGKCDLMTVNSRETKCASVTDYYLWELLADGAGIGQENKKVFPATLKQQN